VWNGKEMIVWGGYTECCPIDSTLHDPGAAAYDPASNRWRTLADVPAPWSGDGGAPVVTRYGSDMLVWRGERLGRFDAAANVWHDLGAPASHPTSCHVSGGPVARGALVGDRFYVWTGGCRAEFGAAYDLKGGAWLDIGPAPEGLTGVAAADDGVYAVIGAPPVSTRRFDVRSGTWVDTPTPVPKELGTSPFVTWTGSTLLVWGGYKADGRSRAAALYRPGP
jgi:hypothetical protein